MARFSVRSKEHAVRLRPITLLFLAGASALCGCAATESSHSSCTTQVLATGAHSRQKLAVSIGAFENHSDFMRGVFFNGIDRLGIQARTSLAAQLAEPGRFFILDRDHGEPTTLDAALQHKPQPLMGADFVVTGDVTSFGLKDVGEAQFFGSFGQSRSQSADAAMTLTIIDSLASKVVYSATGAGEVALTSRDVLGFKRAAGYDSTLNGKVLELAMGEAVSNLIADEDAGLWDSGAHP